MGVINLWGKTAKDTDLNNINTKIGTAADAETAATIFGRLTKVANSITTNWTSFWQAWTAARAAKIDNLDAKISTRAPANTALSNATWTDARAGYLNNLDAKISTRAAANTALSTAVWTNARAGYLDKINTNLDTKLSTVNTNVTNALTAANNAVSSLSETKEEVTGNISAAFSLGPGGTKPGTTKVLEYTGRGRIKSIDYTLGSNYTRSGKFRLYIDGTLVSEMVIESGDVGGKRPDAFTGERFYKSILLQAIDIVNGNVSGMYTRYSIDCIKYK